MIEFVVVGLVFGFGLFVIGAVVVGRIRDKRRWSGPSAPASQFAGQEFEDPAAGGSTAGVDTDTTAAWANGQAESRVLGIHTSPYGSSSGFPGSGS